MRIAVVNIFVYLGKLRNLNKEIYDEILYYRKDNLKNIINQPKLVEK